jgi:hypothetical protein
MIFVKLPALGGQVMASVRQAKASVHPVGVISG